MDTDNPVSILHKSIAGRYRPVRVADGPIMARCRFIKNATLENKTDLAFFWEMIYFKKKERISFRIDSFSEESWWTGE